MHRIPRKWWKRIHLTSYVLFWTGALHGALAGTDAGNPIYVGSMVGLIVLVSGLTVHRVLTARKFRGVFRAPAPSSA
jgi:DMSO/TMAO reductase YedYZ heme-binding membrane subunit